MEKEYINIGHTNKVKYKEGNTFVIIKDKNQFNHKIDYSILSEFDFVPKLIEETNEKIVWEYIEGEMLNNPTHDDLKQMGKILRTLHKSNAKFPKWNIRKRVQEYVTAYNAKGVKVPEIENHYRKMSKLISRMNNINPVHNDVWNQNIIKDKNGKLWLVDWEYATMGDKHFDLAFYIASQNMNKEEEKIFLDEYNSYDDYNAYIPEWMDNYKKFTAWLTIVWAYAQPKMPFDLEPLKKILR